MDDPLASRPVEATRRLLRRLPKAELHLHLDGSLRPDTALELARERGLDEGLDLPGMVQRLAAPARCVDQAELLRAFELPIALLQDRPALTRATHELVADVAGDGTRYVEIRWAPASHTRRGLSLEEVIGAAAAGARSGSLETGCTARLIGTVLRSDPPAVGRAVAAAAVACRAEGVVGLDLAGPEASFPDPFRHRAAFDVAREAGLGITVHAGEWGGAAQVRRALELGVDRIAHGAVAWSDPGLVHELRDRQVTLDLCPSSNVQVGVFRDLADHPLPHLLRAGVPVTLSTDDRTVSSLTLVDEYVRAYSILGLSLAELCALDRHALRVAFLFDEEPVRERLLAELTAFAAGTPELVA